VDLSCCRTPKVTPLAMKELLEPWLVNVYIIKVKSISICFPILVMFESFISNLTALCSFEAICSRCECRQQLCHLKTVRATSSRVTNESNYC
jgi:hypothetical protein